MSSERMFLIAIDVMSPTFNPDTVKSVLKTSSIVKGWWNHIPGCFLVTSDADADRVTDEIRTATGDARLLVIAVDPVSSEGWLPPRSWEWITRRESQFSSEHV